MSLAVEIPMPPRNEAASISCCSGSRYSERSCGRGRSTRPTSPAGPVADDAIVLHVDETILAGLHQMPTHGLSWMNEFVMVVLLPTVYAATRLMNATKRKSGVIEYAFSLFSQVAVVDDDVVAGASADAVPSVIVAVERLQRQRRTTGRECPPAVRLPAAVGIAPGGRRGRADREARHLKLFRVFVTKMPEAVRGRLDPSMNFASRPPRSPDPRLGRDG
jgi:hypothetical protein